MAPHVLKESCGFWQGQGGGALVSGNIVRDTALGDPKQMSTQPGDSYPAQLGGPSLGPTAWAAFALRDHVSGGEGVFREQRKG